MKRRSAIRQLALAFGGLTTIPAWAVNWSPKTLSAKIYLSASNDLILSEIAETILPETTTPGAKSLQIPAFIQRMVFDCYGQQATKTLNDGLVATNVVAQKLYTQDFLKCSAVQKLAVFKQLQQDETTKEFANSVKELTTWGYTSSEFYQTTYTDYNMAPGFYHGCVPVAS